MTRAVAFVAATVPLVSGAGCRATASSQAEVAARALAVETGLLPIVIAAGRPPRPMTMRERMAHYDVPGVSLAVVNDGRVEWARGYGRVAAGGAAVDSTTLFQAGSISKPVSAAAALRLVATGALVLDADVNERLRSWRIPPSSASGGAVVTLRQILTHRAGLTVHGFLGYPRDAAWPGLRDLLDSTGAANSPPVRVAAVPGAAYAYSGGGFLVLQQLVEDVTGKDFASVVRELVLAPAGMGRSAFAQPLPESLAVNAARGHGRRGEEEAGGWRVHPELAAAGLWSTAADLARFILFAQRGAQLLAPQADSARSLAFELEGSGPAARFRHDGSTIGYRASLLGTIASGRGVVILTNGAKGDMLIREIVNAVAAVYHWPGVGPDSVPAVVYDAGERYAGGYHVRGAEVLRVSFDGASFYVHSGGHAFEVFPRSETEFASLEAPVRLRFTLEAGRVRAMHFSQPGTDLDLVKQ